MVAALTDKGMPPPPPPIPVTAQHLPAGAAVTPTTIDQNYYNGNYIPVFVDIFKAVKSVFVDDTLDVFTRYTGGKEYLVHQRPEPGTGRHRNRRRAPQPVPAELLAE